MWLSCLCHGMRTLGDRSLKNMPCAIWSTSSQAKGTKSTPFLTRKERSGLSTLGLQRCMVSKWVKVKALLKAEILQQSVESLSLLYLLFIS